MILHLPRRRLRLVPRQSSRRQSAGAAAGRGVSSTDIADGRSPSGCEFIHASRGDRAITGTSGKTSVAAFTRQIWAALDTRPASAPSASTGKREVYGSLTT
jgi:hypothetical protein